MGGFLLNPYIYSPITITAGGVSIAGYTTGSTFGRKTAPSASFNYTGAVSGNLFILTIANADWYGLTNVTWSGDIPSASWTIRTQNPSITNSGKVVIFSTPVTRSGNFSITFRWPNATNDGCYSGVLYELSGVESTLGGATSSANSQTAPSASITTTRANSLLICVSSDWNAVNGTSSRVIRDSATEVVYEYYVSDYQGFHYYKQASTITTYTEGYSAPTGQSAGTSIYEVRTP